MIELALIGVALFFFSVLLAYRIGYVRGHSAGAEYVCKIGVAEYERQFQIRWHAWT